MSAASTVSVITVTSASNPAAVSGVVRVVDSDASTHAIADSLRSSGFAVQAFADPTEFWSAFESERPGCVICEWHFPGHEAGAVLAELQKRGNPLPLIVLTARADVPMAVAAMRGGAYSVLQKPCPLAETLATVQSAVQSDLARRGKQSYRDEVLARVSSLSSGERDIMHLALSGKMNREIAAQLGIGLRTVEKRRHNVMLKMRADSLAELMQLAMLVELVTVLRVDPSSTAASPTVVQPQPEIGGVASR